MKVLRKTDQYNKGDKKFEIFCEDHPEYYDFLDLNECNNDLQFVDRLFLIDDYKLQYKISSEFMRFLNPVDNESQKKIAQTIH